MLLLEVKNTKCTFFGNLPDHIAYRLNEELSYRHLGYMYIKNSNSKWDGVVRLFKNNSFPIGLLAKVEKILKDTKTEYKLVDERPKIKYGEPIPIKNSKFKFRDYQKEAIDLAMKEGSGVVKMATGCHARGTEVLMYDGSIKRVEDIIIGDLIMGPDSKPRKVLQLCRGKDRMVKIIPTKGESFTINQEHILSLKRTRCRASDKLAGNIEDIKFSEWENLSDYGKHIRKLFRVGVDFSKKQLSMDPYLMGLLLGDGGFHASVGITSADEEIISYCELEAEKLGLKLRKNGLTYYFTTGFTNNGQNKLINIIRKEGLYQTRSGTKFIPQDYKTSDRKDRLSLLAGLLDTDGSYDGSGYYFISKSERLAKDLAFVARSLGFAAYVSRQKKICTNNGVEGYYFRVSLSGELSEIPCKLPRKKAAKRLQKKDVLVTGFSYEEAGYDDYFGFKVDGDNRYLLSDFTVTHNSGKTFTLSSIVANYNVKTIIYVIGVELMYQMYETLKEAYGIEAGLIGDGKCDVKKINIATIWSAAAAFNKKIDVLDSDVTYDKNSNKELDKLKVREAVNSAELFILDECQYAAANTVQFLHRESRAARHRFLFSASPWRDSGDDILIEAVGGKKIYDLKASKLIDDGFLVRPHIHFIDVPSMRGIGKTYQEVYKNYIVENEVRNNLICKSVEKLLEKNKKILILVVRINHGKKLLEVLQDKFRVDYLDGKKSSEQRMNAIKSMKNGELDVLIASKIFDQGVDIPELDALILAGSGKSTGRALQRIGRVIRKSEGKEKAIVVEFYDNAKYLNKHSEVRMEVYESEPSFIIKKSKKHIDKYLKRKPFKWT